MPRKTTLVGLFGVVLFVIGSYDGLFVAPADRFMGDIQRIMYVHVPCAWNTLVTFTISLVAAVGFLCSEQAGFITGQNILMDGGIFPGAF